MNRRITAWFRSLLRQSHVEIDFHRPLPIHETAARGVAPEGARREAPRDSGKVEQEERGAKLWLEQLWQDVRYGLRVLRNSPGFATLAVVTLGLGIGANSTMFSVIDAVLLQPPPFRDPSRVVVVWQKQPNGSKNTFSTPDFLEWKRQLGPVAHMAAARTDSHTLGTRDELEQIIGAKVSSEMFAVAGVAPVMGRPFTADEDKPGAGNFILISDSLWKTRFQADPQIVGSKLSLDGAPYTVLGVMPAGFYSLINTERFWLPLQLQTQEVEGASRGVHWLFGLARLDPGNSIQQSQSQLDAISARLHRDDPRGDAGFGVVLQPHQDAATDNLRESLVLLMGGVGFVLLIACANVTNLLLARNTTRRLEMSVRAALGARRSRVIRQLLTEGILLSILGGAFGLLVAVGALKFLLVLHPSNISSVESIAINPAVLGFTMVICLGAGVLFGLLPALATSRVDLNNALRQASRGTGGSAGRQRATLVVMETALASILLIGAGLSIKSLWKVSHVNPGFNPGGLFTFKVSAPAGSTDRPYLFYQQVVEKVRALPGVQQAFLARDVPLSGADPSMAVWVDGHLPPAVDGQIVTRMRIIGPDYFHGFETPLLRGREFTIADSAGSQPVTIVSQSLAQRYWPGQDPVGRTLKPNIPDAPWFSVVGLVADVRHRGLDADIEPTAYYPSTQIPKSLRPIAERVMTIVVRSGSTAGLTEEVRTAVAEVDKTVPVFEMKTADEILADAGSLRRFDMWLLSAFAGVALALAAAGVYGVMAYSVSQRTREIGLRMALGANRRDILRLVVGQGAKLALTGAALGLAGAFVLTRLMASLLYQVSPTDVWTFALVSVALVGVILAACYVPSRYAMEVDPNEALRCE